VFFLFLDRSANENPSGLEADQKAIAAHGCYAMTSTTALTAQDTTGVHAIHMVPPQFVAQQIDACLRDIGADAIKTGMLASAETIEVVVSALSVHQIKSVVVDPVCRTLATCFNRVPNNADPWY
jgi:hydroxymethylpyrimidine kinase/phosphomethylpyrimidine kinase